MPTDVSEFQENGVRVGVGPEGVGVSDGVGISVGVGVSVDDGVSVGIGVSVGAVVGATLGLAGARVGVSETAVVGVTVGRVGKGVGVAGAGVGLGDAEMGKGVRVTAEGATGVTATILPAEFTIHCRTNRLRSPKFRASCFRPLKETVAPGRFSTRR